jgi:hypothetical protein
MKYKLARIATLYCESHRRLEKHLLSPDGNVTPGLAGASLEVPFGKEALPQAIRRSPFE